MGFLMDLDEYDEADLIAEIERRAAARASGHCDYCGRTLGSRWLRTDDTGLAHTVCCKHPERHDMEQEN